jgi:hypothetical protein
MKAGWAFLLSGILIIAIGVAWIFTGWSAGTSTSSPDQSSSSSFFPGLPSLGPSAGEGTVATRTPVTPTPTVPETPVARETPALSSDDVRLHFLDLAFGAGNANLERWNATDNNGRIVISLTANNNADTRLLENAARDFNSISKTNQISEMIKQGGTGDITIKFIPENGMEGIAINATDGRTSREFSIDGVTAAKISRGSVYINANLKGDVRNHTLIRSLFYELGVVGDTDTYPDSLFSSGDNTNTNLTLADKKAIEILYGNGLTPGMSANEVKGIIYNR